MKKITAYINTMRVHWLVDELEATGITEIMVTEYFSPSSKISRMELFAKDEAVDQVREMIHRVGTTGEPGDHSLFIEEYDPKLPSQIPLGKRTSKLEESRIKQLVNFMLHGTHRKIRAAFLFMTVSILGVALFVGLQTEFVQKTAEENNGTVQLFSEATNAVQTALLEEMLAVERFHRGEPMPALEDYRNARTKLGNAISDLRETAMIPGATVARIANLEQRFHVLAEGMFDIAHSLSKNAGPTRIKKDTQLFTSHNLLMSALDDLRAQLVRTVASFGREVKELLRAKEERMHRSIREVGISLLLLIGVAIAVTTTIWLLVEREVSRPIQRLVAEAKTIDTTVLK